LLLSLVVVIAYTLIAYLVLPAFWTHYEHQKGLENLPMVTRTGQGIPGDPINVGLVGDQKDVVCAMHEAGWYPADPITLKSSIEIVGSVLLDRPYKDAPVSNLYYLGRREDLAFEKPIGQNADRRNHVRYWKVLDQGEEKRPVWLGAATEDRGVGVSRYTAEVTHHISADLDAERARQRTAAVSLLEGSSAPARCAKALVQHRLARARLFVITSARARSDEHPPHATALGVA